MIYNLNTDEAMLRKEWEQQKVKIQFDEFSPTKIYPIYLYVVFYSEKMDLLNAYNE